LVGIFGDRLLNRCEQGTDISDLFAWLAAQNPQEFQPFIVGSKPNA
jgi:hypothetical protein